jgi:hypothetical protein
MKNTNTIGNNRNNPIFCLLRIARAKDPPAMIRKDRFNNSLLVIDDSRIAQMEHSPKSNAVCSM